jgi:hypothetical protein
MTRVLRGWGMPVSVVLLVAGGAHALPPAIAPPNTTVYRQSIVRNDDGGKRTFDDTVTITAAGKRARWQKKSDGQTTVYDGVAKTITMWGGGLPEKEALRSALPDAMSSWDLGYGTIAADGGPPTEKGTATIAGQECTRLAFTSKRYGNPELCVTATGIVAKFFLDDPEDKSVTTFEAERITAGDPPAGAFDVPAGTTVQTMDRM